MKKTTWMFRAMLMTIIFSSGIVSCSGDDDKENGGSSSATINVNALIGASFFMPFQMEPIIDLFQRHKLIFILLDRFETFFQKNRRKGIKLTFLLSKKKIRFNKTKKNT